MRRRRHPLNDIIFVCLVGFRIRTLFFFVSFTRLRVIITNRSYSRVQIQGLANDFLKDYIQVTIGSQDLTASKHIKQIVEVMGEYDKTRRLFDILKGVKEGHRMLIFAETKRGCDSLTRELRTQGWPALSIHGDKSQSERDWVLNEFRAGKQWLMVATDVASRGIDVKDIKLVVNFDMPNNGIEDYIHRIGRTGRKTLNGYAEGTAITFFTEKNARLARDLVHVLREAEQDVPRELDDMARMHRGGKSKGRGRRRGGGSRGGGYGRSGSNNIPLGRR